MGAGGRDGGHDDGTPSLGATAPCLRPAPPFSFAAVHISWRRPARPPSWAAPWLQGGRGNSECQCAALPSTHQTARAHHWAGPAAAAEQECHSSRPAWAGARPHHCASVVAPPPSPPSRGSHPDLACRPPSRSPTCTSPCAAAWRACAKATARSSRLWACGGASRRCAAATTPASGAPCSRWVQF